MKIGEFDTQKERALKLKSRLDLFRNIAFGIAIALCPLAILPLLRLHPDLSALSAIVSSAVAYVYLGDALELHLIENPDASRSHRLGAAFGCQLLPVLMVGVNFAVATSK